MPMEPHPDPATRWKNRRRMAYASLGGLLALTGGVITGNIDPSGADLGKAIAYALAGIIVTYIGGAVIDDKNFLGK